MFAATSSKHQSDTFAAPSPPFPWLRAWLLIVLVAATGIAGQEAVWRSRGYLPTVPDSQELWSYWRQRVYRDDGRVIVLLGTSRMQADVPPACLRRRFPDYRVVQLAVATTAGPCATLRELAHDQRFKGVVICEMLPPYVPQERWDDPYRFRPSARMPAVVDTVVHCCARQMLAAMRPQLSVRTSVAEWWQPNPARDAKVRSMMFDRALQLRFAAADDIDTLRQSRTRNFRSVYEVERLPAMDFLRDDWRQINSYVERLESRGSRVAFVRLPSSGERFRLEEQYHPRRLYWDRLAQSTSATCVHFADVSSSNEVQCPDGSHLDYNDTPQFTDRLAGALIRRRLFPEVDWL